MSVRNTESSPPPSLHGLEESIDRALYAGEHVEALFPTLARLASRAEVGSDAWAYATTQVAALLAHRDPWRASLLARRVVAERPREAAAHAVLGLAQSMLGNHRFAIASYEQALAIDPDDVVVLHNVGHLYDVALDEPRRAIRFLARALRRAHATHPRRSGARRTMLPFERGELAASLAHALARAGFVDLAGRVLGATRDGETTRTQHEIAAWIARARA